MKLLGFAGKKQSGKDTAAKFIHANADLFWGYDEHVGYSEPLEFGGTRHGTRQRRVTPQVYTMYFGGPMKDFAEHWLGVEHHKLWGTDEQKNEPTHITWDDLPHFRRLVGEEYGLPASMGPKYLTGRQLLQQIGEEMFLSMNPRIWTNRFKLDFHDTIGFINRTENLMVKHPLHIAVVADPRKPEQIDTLHELGGKVIRFLRDPYQVTDRHVSEIALDPPYDQSNFDAIIDNRNLSIAETHRQVLKWLRHWGWVTGTIDLEKVQWEPQ